MLTAGLGVAVIKGMQKRLQPDWPPLVVATAKHFFACEQTAGSLSFLRPRSSADSQGPSARFPCVQTTSSPALWPVAPTLSID